MKWWYNGSATLAAIFRTAFEAGDWDCQNWFEDDEDD
jgi:hypothetical protein